MALTAPPGGWCITIRSNTKGISSLPLLYGPTDLITFLTLSIAAATGRTIPSVESGIRQALADMAPLLPSSANEGAELIWSLWKPNSQLITQMANNQLAVGAKLHTITGIRLPLLQFQAATFANTAQTNAETYARNYADDVYNILRQDLTLEHAYATFQAAEAKVAAEGYANDRANQVTANSAQRSARVTATGLSRSDTVARYADTLATDVATFTEQETAHLRSELQSVTDWADQQITQTRSQAATDAANSANTAIADQNRTVSTTLAPIWAGTAESMNQAGTDVAQLVPAVAPTLTAVPTDVPPDLATALQGITNGLRSVSTAVDNCALPNCSEKNKLAKQAKTIGALIGDGVMLAFLLAAITEPTATAAASIDVVETIVTPVVDAVKAVA